MLPGHPESPARSASTASTVSASLAALVVAVAHDPGEPQRHAGRVARRGLHAVERDLDHQLGPHPAPPSRRSARRPARAARSVCQASIASVSPLNVLPSITKPPGGPNRPSGSSAPRCRLDSLPVRRPWPHSAARMTRSSVCTGLTLTQPDPAPAHGVGRGVGLDHDALVPTGHRVGGEGLRRGDLRRVGRVGDVEPRHQQVGRRPGRATALRRNAPGWSSRSSPDRCRASNTKTVSGVASAPATGSERVPVRDAVCWNGRGPPVRPQGQHLAVEHRLVRHAGPDRGDDLGHPVGHLVERAGEDAHLVAAAVQLHPDAVELPLDPGRPGATQRLGHRRRRPGQHRRERHAHGQPERRPARRRPRSVPRPPPAPRSPARVWARRTAASGTLGGPGDRGQHHALLGALAQLAADQAAEQPLLGRRRPAEQVGQHGAPRGLRARRRTSPAARSNALSTSATVSVGSVDGAGSSRRAVQPSPVRRWRSSPRSHDTTACTASGPSPCGHPQRGGDALDLRGARRRARHVGVGVSDLTEQHG